MLIGRKGQPLTPDEMRQLKVVDDQGRPVKQRARWKLDASLVDEEARTVPLSFSSEEPFERWFGTEILDHKAKCVRAGRLKQGLSLLVEHDPEKIVGVLEDGVVNGLRGTGVGRFGNGAFAAEVFQDVRDGIRRYVSIGYWVHKMVLEEDGDNPVYRVTDWEPLEVSIVAVPADATVGIGRDAEDGLSDAKAVPVNEEKHVMKFCPHCGRPADDCKAAPCDGVRSLAAPPAPEPAAPVIRVEEVRNAAAESERQRARTIREIGEKFEMRELAQRAVDAGTDVETFRKQFIQEMEKRATPYNPDKPKREIGMSRRDLNEFSLFRLFHAMADGRRVKCLELEACDAWAHESGRTPGSDRSVLLPPDVLYRSQFYKRDITDAAEGADMTGIEHSPGMFIDVLRASNPVLEMATILDGLVGDVRIPRQASAVSASWETEVTAVDEGTPTFDNVTLSPNRVGAFIEVTRRAMLQFTPSVENLIRQDLLKAVSLAIGTVAIKGAGSNEPTGILQTSGIGSVLAGGSDCDWTVVINLEREVDTDNALMGRLSYLTNPLVRAQMKRIVIDTGSGQFVWDRQSPSTPVNGYPVAVTTLVPSNLGAGTNRSACIFGNFSDLLIGLWDTAEIIVNPYTRDTEGIIRVTIQHEVDVDVRHAESFAAAQDIDHAA